MDQWYYKVILQRTFNLGANTTTWFSGAVRASMALDYVPPTENWLDGASRSSKALDYGATSNTGWRHTAHL